MREWTPAAKDAFDRYCASVREKLAAQGADPAEVFEDLRGHVDREADAAGLQVLTQEDVQQILARIGSLGDGPTALPEPPSAVPSGAKVSLEKRPWFQWTAGVVLPVIAIVLEAATGWCASTFFDPLPTPVHLLLACLVPAANAWLLRQPGGQAFRHPGWTAATSGAAVGSLCCLRSPSSCSCRSPSLPSFSSDSGYCRLTPPLALIASIRIAGRVRRQVRPGGGLPRALVYGFGTAVLAFLLADLPKTATTLGLRMAAGDNPETSQRGVALLRVFGSTDYLLRACYDRSGVPMDLVSFALQPLFAGSVAPTQARAIFYRVTGTPFNQLPPPPTPRARETGATVPRDACRTPRPSWPAARAPPQARRPRGTGTPSCRGTATAARRRGSRS